MWIEPAIRIDAGVEYEANVVAVGQDTIQELPPQLAQLFLALRVPEKVLAVLADRNVGVHAAAIYSHDGLREKTRGEPHIRGHLATDQLVELNLIRSSHHLSIAIVDLELRWRDLWMILLVLEAHRTLYFRGRIDEGAQRIARQ